MVDVHVTVKHLHVRYVWYDALKGLEGGDTTICRGGHLIETISSSTHCFPPKCHRTVSLLHHGMHAFSECSVSSFSNAILLWGVVYCYFEKDAMLGAIVL